MPKPSRDRLVIVDIEATCWENNQPPPGQQNEIIEIGICLLDPQTGAIEDNRGILVKPTRSKVSTFCTELTTLTQAQVDAGIDFASACDILFNEYKTRHYYWASWGAFDRRMFSNQCREFGVTYPFTRYHINLKNVYRFSYQLRRRVGMKRALNSFNIEMEGTHHRGVDDARAIARITECMIVDHGVDAIFDMSTRP